MKGTIKILLLFLILSSLFSAIVSYCSYQQQKTKKKFVDTIDVQFTGKIISKREIKKYGTPLGLACIAVSYSNVDSIKIFNPNTHVYLNLKKKVATMVVSVVCKADSISVNMNNDRMQRYYLNGRLIEEYPMTLFCSSFTDKELDSLCLENH